MKGLACTQRWNKANTPAADAWTISPRLHSLNFLIICAKMGNCTGGRWTWTRSRRRSFGVTISADNRHEVDKEFMNLNETWSCMMRSFLDNLIKRKENTIKLCCGHILYLTSAGAICPQSCFVRSVVTYHCIVHLTAGKTAKLGSVFWKAQMQKEGKSKEKALGRIIQLYTFIMIFIINRLNLSVPLLINTSIKWIYRLLNFFRQFLKKQTKKTC